MLVYITSVLAVTVNHSFSIVLVMALTAKCDLSRFLTYFVICLLCCMMPSKTHYNLLYHW